uniref:Fucolectin tachylectin-4 pentraxin-1 domain-containing protein n=1 Tax=Scleropages formosus TaxID=113540 RepID=A0A8C9TPD4_SCLFO
MNCSIVIKCHTFLSEENLWQTGCKNVALKGTATQSSQFDSNGARSCTHTKQDSKPWWRVDLHNVGDCCPESINGAEIRVGNSLDDNGNQNPLYVVLPILTCNGMTGRYVNVVLPRPDFLTLCEVQVYGYTSTGWYKLQSCCFHMEKVLSIYLSIYLSNI